MTEPIKLHSSFQNSMDGVFHQKLTENIDAIATMKTPLYTQCETRKIQANFEYD